jgi:putative transcriptional regulator
MVAKLKFKSDLLESIHTSARGLHEIGALDKMTMRHFEEACLSVPPSLSPEQIKHIREQNRVSQSIFANHLNTSPSTVQKWETGAKQPSGMALKLLAIVQKHGLAILS